MTYRQGRVGRTEVSERRQRHGGSVGGAYVDVLQCLRALGKFRCYFHDDVILV